MIIKISTDGSTVRNPGPGGWAAVFRCDKRVKAIYGFDPQTTNNRMEMTAAIRALEHLDRECNVTLYCDSLYVINGITKWIYNWKKKDFVTTTWVIGSDGKPKATGTIKDVINRDLWERLDRARERHIVLWEWVRGHSIHKDNLLCDEIAKRAARKQIAGTVMIEGQDVRKTFPCKTPGDIVRSITFEDL